MTKALSEEQIVAGMCMTMRHDYGLDKNEDDVLSSGMTAVEQAALERQMRQLYAHHVAPAVKQAAHDERLQCAQLCLKMARGHGDIDRTSSAYQVYLLIMARDERVAAIVRQGKSVEEAVFESQIMAR